MQYDNRTYKPLKSYFLRNVFWIRFVLFTKLLFFFEGWNKEACKLVQMKQKIKATTTYSMPKNPENKYG